VYVNVRLKAGDVVYLIAAHDELYGWGHVNKRESYQDSELNRRAYRITVTRPVVQQDLLTAGEIQRVPQLARLLSSSEANLVELQSDEVGQLNLLISSKGVPTPPDMVADESEISQTPLLHNYPKIDISPEVRVWLESAYVRLKEGKKVVPTEMLIELWGKVPEDFDYTAIDHRLIRFGSQLTLLGILHLNPGTELVSQTDRVLRFIQDLIRKESGIEEVTAEQVSEALELQKERVALIFGLIKYLGNFFNGAGGHGNILGYTSITIGDEDVKREYLKYKDVESLLERLYRNGKQEDEIVEARGQVPAEFVHSLLDWKLGERLETGLDSINRLSADEVMAFDTERLTKMVERFAVVPPIARTNQRVRDERTAELEDLTTDLKTGDTGHLFLIPIDGESEWLQEVNMQVVANDGFPLAFLDEKRSWIYIKLRISLNDPDGTLKRKLEERLELIARYAAYVSGRIISFNRDLADKMTGHLNQRKKALQKARIEAEAVGLPSAYNPKHSETAILLGKLMERLNRQFISVDMSPNRMHPLNQQNATEVSNRSAMPSIDIFISHSSQDIEIAKSIIQLLRAALTIPAERIRCTSVDGYRLPLGVSTDERLRREVREAKIFLGIITQSSIESTYVLFELGARWGAELHLAPILASSTDKRLLLGPLAQLNALACNIPAQVHQLVDDVASQLGVSLGRASSYQEQVEALVEIARNQSALKSTYLASTQISATQSTNFDRITKHVSNYFVAKGFKNHVGFERIRKYVNPLYDDEILFEMIDRCPDKFRRVTLKGGKPAVGLVKSSEI
jgi:hypothetical protein